jgi:hypothetical protein
VGLVLSVWRILSQSVKENKRFEDFKDLDMEQATEEESRESSVSKKQS